MNEPTTSKDQANQQIARAATIVFIAMAVGQLVGQLAKSVTVSTFGAAAELDAYNAANRVSETVYLLVAGGALGSSFIPVFTGLLTTEKKKEAWKLASSIINLVTIILIALSILVMIFAELLVKNILAPSFPADQQLLTASLLRVLMPTTIIFGASGLFMGMLNSHQKFLLPALAPSMYQIGIILGVLFLTPAMGIYGLAWGTLLGAFLHLLIQLPQVLRLPHRQYDLVVNIKNERVREVILLMLPRLLGVAVVQLNFWVNTIIASGLRPGSLTAITIGFALMLMPQTVIGQATATAALPTYAAQYAQGKIDDFRSSLAATLRVVLLLSIPAMIGMIVLRHPLVRMFYGYGAAANSEATQMIAAAVLWYTVGLVSHSIYEILARAFYALHDTRTPVIVGVIAMSLNVVLSYLFVALFRSMQWLPLGGLALANSLATTIEMVVLIIVMSRRLKGLELPSLLITAVKAVISAGVMAIALYFWLDFSQQAVNPILITLVGAGAGIIIYFTLIYFLRVQELSSLIETIKKRVFHR
ncbi:MAG: murein biosynthesis integral membrane protein MurJ [Anaerolineae bacterium]|jgi:putative peptidoglycan lipid II flippase|nr:murein biosynthesis integral membrane protein MurJ [Anaerolineae bacterium]